MRILLALFLLLGLFIASRAQGDAATCDQLRDTDWQRDELCYRVRRIRTYEQWFKKDDRSGAVIAGEQRLEEETNYDRLGNQILRSSAKDVPHGTEILSPSYTRDFNGRIIETRYVRSDGTLSMRITYAYDDKGRKIEEAHYFPDDSLEWRQRYLLDEKGNTIEEVLTEQVHPEHFIPKRYDVYVTTKTIFKYDSQNNQIEEKAFYPNGSLCTTWVRSFDAENRMIKEFRSDKQNRPEDLTLNIYDRSGNLIQETHYSNFCYNRDGTMCDGKLTTDEGVFYYGTKTTYEYDAKRNWVKQTEYIILELAGEKSFEPSKKVYRKIAYY
jgi:antitoxin component YwqK of YwqJK toxin-antitoxin module